LVEGTQELGGSEPLLVYQLLETRTGYLIVHLEHTLPLHWISCLYEPEISVYGLAGVAKRVRTVNDDRMIT
jgi:hypothetical protein